MSEDDVDPEHPRPAGHYHADRDATWYYVDDELARTVALGPATDGEAGDDWILSFTAAGRDDPKRVDIRLTPTALNELYIETKDLHPDSRQAGHTAECALCGTQVPLEDAWPDGEGRPTHPDCWSEAYQTPLWRE